MHAILPCYTCIFMTSTTFSEDIFSGLNLALVICTYTKYIEKQQDFGLNPKSVKPKIYVVSELYSR